MITITALPTETVRALQAGAADAYGAPPERHVAQGSGNPCRHCLTFIAEGAEMLILAYRPFAGLHPYAETGPIFLCAAPCARHEGGAMPEVLCDSPDYLLKGYDTQDRIVYGTGRVVAAAEVAGYAQAVLERPEVAYLHVRSARNNCYQARIDRG
ncbi:DUF1203 domain-containing protein [Roseovarius sp.]|uniref:DUF1203 domain-containing protein n=1 Tax=Roseovarius sp. TaxID=1486281 RepID=UPI003A969C90